MRRAALSLFAVLLCNPSLAAPEPARREAVDQAIDRALDYLHRSQNPDGSWNAAGDKSAAITGLSVMAFLSAGHVPGEGRYGATVEKGIRWVLRSQHESGLFSTQPRYQMYHHGICTLMLAQVAGMTSDEKLAEEIRSRLEKAVEVILQAQWRDGTEIEGGWGYFADTANNQRYADISIAGWQLLSLRAAKNLGCDVPAERIELALKYVKRCHEPSTGAFNYKPNFRPSVACTGTGILSLELCGKHEHRSEMALRAGDHLVKHPPGWGSNRFFYAVYYCSQATFQLGGKHWKDYRPSLHKALLPFQGKDGSWHGIAGEDATYGPNYGSAMAVLALTPEYRYLPIYQSGEDRQE